MEYHQKKSQILQSVEYTNLLSFTLVENKLEKNFKSIVQALLLNQGKIDSLNNQHTQVKEKHSNEIADLYEKINQLRNELENQKKQQQKLATQELHSAKISTKQLSKKSLPEPQVPLKNAIDTNKQSDLMDVWQKDKANLLNQINDLRNKLGMVGYLQNEIDNVKKDLQGLKGEFLTVGNNIMGNGNNNKSNKSLIKRESILNMAGNSSMNRISDRIIDPSRHSIKALLIDENKENSQSSTQPHVPQLIEKSLNSIYLDINTFKISFEQMRDMLSDVKKQGYKNNLSLNQLKEDLNKEIKVRAGETSDLEKEIKQLKMQIMNLAPINQLNTEEKQGGENVNKSTSNNNRTDDRDNLNYKNHLNDKLSKLQSMVSQLPTENQFNKFKGQVQDKFDKIQSKLDNFETGQEDLEARISQKIVENDRAYTQQFQDLRAKITVLQEQAHNQASQSQRKNNILQGRLQQLKKSLQNLRQDVQFYQTMNTEIKQQKKPESSKIVQKQQSKSISASSGVGEKALQELKRGFNHKLQELRTNLLNTIRDLQKKLGGTRPTAEQQIVKLWDKLNELGLFLGKKADQDDTRKTVQYLQKKIGRLNSMVFRNEDNTQDARIARTNQWHCLSCDKNLQSYQGKIGRHIVWDSMPLKGINKNSIDDKKKGLPVIKR